MIKEYNANRKKKPEPILYNSALGILGQMNFMNKSFILYRKNMILLFHFSCEYISFRQNTYFESALKRHF